jgi:hypothetical protein
VLIVVLFSRVIFKRVKVTHIILYVLLYKRMRCSRYQFFLQLKQDILQGRVPVTQELMAELGAYVVQCK